MPSFISFDQAVFNWMYYSQQKVYNLLPKLLRGEANQLHPGGHLPSSFISLSPHPLGLCHACPADQSF